jgi:FAD/FMN-containing dehydrogenase
MTLEMSDAAGVDVPTPAALELRSLCGELVTLPGEPAYAAARMPWNVALDQRPAAVAVPHDVDDVRLIVRAAAAVGLRVAPQGTGHGAQTLVEQSLSDVVLLRTGALTDVTVDPEHRVVRAESGAIWEQVVEAAAPHGLAALHGSSPDVGVAGLALGGGIGWYARKLGMTSNAVTAVELVTADGRLVHADAEHEPDLFWAVRGAGANVGIVTAIEMRLFDVPSVYAGQMVWELGDYERVLRAWNDWAPTAPDEISTSVRAMRFPPIPHVPEHLRGRQLVILDGGILADDARAAEILAPFRALGPQVDTWGRKAPRDIVRMHGDPEGPTPAVGCGRRVDRLAEEDLVAFVAAVGPQAQTTVLIAELRQLGGTLAREPEVVGAVATMRGDYAAYFVTMAPTPEAAEHGRAATGLMLASLDHADSGGAYLNLAERPVDLSTAVSPAAWERLLEIRRRVDPGRRLLANHEFRD